MRAISQFVILTPTKPLFGEPCNGCGTCCVAQACFLSREYIGSDQSPCVALEWDGQRYHCGLVRNPMKHMRQNTTLVPDELLGPMFAHMLYVGNGCDSEWWIEDRAAKDALGRERAGK